MIRFFQQTVGVAPAFVLSLWGAFILFLHHIAVLNAIQNPRFNGMTVTAGGALLVVAVMYPFVFDSPLGLSSGEAWGRFGTALFGLVPVLIFLAFPRDTFSTLRLLQKTAASTTNGPIMSGAPFDPNQQPTWQSVPANQTAEVLVTDLVWASADPQLRQSLVGRKVKLIGQLIPGKNNNDTLVRMLMICCAADTQAIGVDIKGGAPSFKQGDWLEVQGTVTDVPGEPLLVTPDQLTKIPEPPDPYLQ